MNRYSELRVIPVAAWIIAACVGLGFGACLLWVAIPRDAKLSAWPGGFQVCFSLLMALILVLYILLVGYVNGDAHRRGMRYVMWTLLSIFIPNGIGIILYFILRDPLPRVCPNCAATIRVKGAFCPACGTRLTHVCPVCHGAIEPGWTHCANCGTALQKGL